jgi:hypothetical protein
MQMHVLPESLWTLAYVSILVGGAWAYRTNGAWGAIWLMIGAALLDLATTLLGKYGMPGLAYGHRGHNPLHIAADIAGFIAYALLLASAWLRWRNRIAAMCNCIALMQVIWFLSFIAYLYALYIIPDALMLRPEIK